MADDGHMTQIPDDAVYLGTDMGGEFLRLARQDIRLENGKVLPAFQMELYWAGSEGKPYGEARIGGLIYSGLGIYVPPKVLLDDPAGDVYEPPSLAHIFGKQEGVNNAGVNSDLVLIRLKPRSQDPNGDYVGMIMPVNLK